MSERAIEAAARALAKSKATPDDYGSDEEEAEVIDFIWSAYVPEVNSIIRAYLAALAEDDAAVEKVARAICEGQGLDWKDQFSIHSSNGDPKAHEAFKHDASAAIRALGGE